MFADKPGAKECQDCSAGTFSTGGASLCSNCPKGQFNNEDGLTSCSNCTIDTYNDKEGQTECTDCPAGLNTEFPGATSEDTCTYHFCIAGWAGEEWNCLPCQPGTYSSKGNATECSECGYGKYQSEEQGTSCDKCPTPQTTYGKKSTQESDCEGPGLVLVSDSSKTLIDSKAERPSGMGNVSTVTVNKGEWVLYSKANYIGEAVTIIQGSSYTKGDGQEDTEKVLAAQSYFAVFTNNFCYLKDYAFEYKGDRARDMYDNECKNSTGPGVCRSDSEQSDAVPQCYIADGKLSPCGVPRCIWDQECYSQNGVHYRGDANTVNATKTSWFVKTKFNCSCQSWNDDFPTKHPGTHAYDPGMEQYGLKSSYCRNPDPTVYAAPWCYVGVSQHHDDCEKFAKKTPREACPYVKKCSDEQYYTQDG